MPNFSPLSSTVSFDDLLKANKQQFDRIFSAQTQELGLLGANVRPPTSADLASASLAADGAAKSADLYAMLNERFGSRWSSEVVEQHRAYFDGSFASVNVYDRAKLRPGNLVRGPAIIIQLDATTVIHPQHTGEVDEYLSILIRPDKAA